VQQDLLLHDLEEPARVDPGLVLLDLDLLDLLQQLPHQLVVLAAVLLRAAAFQVVHQFVEDVEAEVRLRHHSAQDVEGHLEELPDVLLLLEQEA